MEEHDRLSLGILLGAFFGIILLGTRFLTMHPWSDEGHYLETVRLFVNSFSLATIKNYSEMHPPLAYMLFAIFGIFCGDYIWVYRLVTMACAAIMFCTLFDIMRKISGRDSFSPMVIAIFMLNPYVWGLSVFIFSDIIGLMFLCLAIKAMLDKRFFLFSIASAAAILCRQYNVFIPMAIALWAMASRGFFTNKEKTMAVIFSFLCLVPPILLFLYWGDIAPPGGMKRWNPRREQGFHLYFIITYITLFAFYAAPAIILTGKKIFTWPRLLVSSLAGLIYFVLPIRPQPLAVEQAHVYTIGFLHKLIKIVTFGNTVVEHIIFYVGFVTGIATLGWLYSNMIYSRRQRNAGSEYLFLFGIIVSTFLALMSCSFFIWEKYLVPIMPILIGWILLTHNSISADIQHS